MKKMLVFFRGYGKESLLGPLFKLLEATLELMVPLVVAGIIQNGIAEKDTGYVVKASLLLVGLGLVGLIFSVVAQYFAAKASVGFVSGVKNALFHHIGKLSYADLDRMGSDTLITRMTGDANQVQSGLNLALRLLLRSPFVVFGAMIMAFTVNASAAMIFVVVIPVLAVVVFGLMLLSIPLYKKVQKGLDRLLGRTRENLAGVRVLRAFCKEEEEKQAFAGENDALTRLSRVVGRVSALMNPLTYVIINVAALFLIRSGALRINEGNLSQGELVALYNYMAQILVELVKLANLIITITRSLASASRIQSVLDTKPSMTYGTRRFEGITREDAVVFDRVSLRYAAGGDNALSSLSFTVKKGETVGIIGGTGAGKSSLVNLIPRFYDVSEGQVRINGVDVREYDETSLREAIGVVPQKALLFSGTIRSNLLWGWNAPAGEATFAGKAAPAGSGTPSPDSEPPTDEILMAAARTAQAEEIVRSKGGLDAPVEAGGQNFSGGQKQRLTIARALVRRPSLLILDDSASALDYATDAALRKALREDVKDTTLFIVSQRASAVMHADKILVLEDGALVGMGTSQELLDTCPLYREIYETQFANEQAKTASKGGDPHGN